MHRFLLHGYITIYSDEEYEKIVNLMARTFHPEYPGQKISCSLLTELQCNPHAYTQGKTPALRSYRPP